MMRPQRLLVLNEPQEYTPLPALVDLNGITLPFRRIRSSTEVDSPVRDMIAPGNRHTLNQERPPCHDRSFASR
jgi:hypothetical protein